MKKLSVFCLLALIFLNSCKDNKDGVNEMEETQTMASTEEYLPFGKKIDREHALSAQEMEEKFSNLKTGDTIDVKFVSSVNSVCKNKGCWMKLDMPEDEEVMVQFKDYAFFVPKDIEDKEVVVEGKAYIAEVSIEDLKHFAKDKGESQAEIDAITKPEKKLSFMAEGVLVEN